MKLEHFKDVILVWTLSIVLGLLKSAAKVIAYLIPADITRLELAQLILFWISIIYTVVKLAFLLWDRIKRRKTSSTLLGD